MNHYKQIRTWHFSLWAGYLFNILVLLQIVFFTKTFIVFVVLIFYGLISQLGWFFAISGFELYFEKQLERMKEKQNEN